MNGLARKSPVMSDTAGPSEEEKPLAEFDRTSPVHLLIRFAGQLKRFAWIRRKHWSSSAWDVWRNVRRSWEKEADDAALNERLGEIADWMSCREDESSDDSVAPVCWDHFDAYAPAASSTGQEAWRQNWSSRWKWTADADWSGRAGSGHGSSELQ